MTLDQILLEGILPALSIIGVKDSPQGRVMLFAIGLQESRFEYRRQLNNGPARGFWQFERGGGVRGVLSHPVSQNRAQALCRARKVQAIEMSVWRALEHDDVLAAGFARLLLLTDPRALPAVTDASGAWDYYIRNWRPGKPHPETWAGFHQLARGAVQL